MSNIEPLFYTRKQVTQLTGIPHSTLCFWADNGRFPEPITMGGKLVRYRRDEVHAWIDALKPKGK